MERLKKSFIFLQGLNSYFLRQKFIHFIFFGNYFYALCAVALSVEASVQQGIPLNTPTYYFLLASGTIVYYTYAYWGQVNFCGAWRKAALPKIALNKNQYCNERTQWYVHHFLFITLTQLFFIAVTLASALYLSIKVFHEIFSLHWIEWLVLLIVPAVAALYYSNDYLPFIKINLRKSGWAKPFVIGFVWAAAVTVYPVMFYKWQMDKHYSPSVEGVWFFIKNWMFITVLCIMFDIKDYADDYNQNLKTFVVRVGLRKTIFSILLPISAVGLIAFWIFAALMRFGIVRIAINTIPFICLIVVAYSMYRRKSILYYLMVIDGLMLLKALCGITASWWAK